MKTKKAIVISCVCVIVAICVAVYFVNTKKKAAYEEEYNWYNSAYKVLASHALKYIKDIEINGDINDYISTLNSYKQKLEDTFSTLNDLYKKGGGTKHIVNDYKNITESLELCLSVLKEQPVNIVNWAIASGQYESAYDKCFS